MDDKEFIQDCIEFSENYEPFVAYFLHMVWVPYNDDTTISIGMCYSFPDPGTIFDILRIDGHLGLPRDYFVELAGKWMYQEGSLNFNQERRACFVEMDIEGEATKGRLIITVTAMKKSHLEGKYYD